MTVAALIKKLQKVKVKNKKVLVSMGNFWENIAAITEEESGVYIESK